MSDLLAQLTECGIILKGHFVLPEGRHSDASFDERAITENPILLEPLCAEISRLVSSSKPGRIVGASNGGAIVASSVARHLGAFLSILNFGHGTTLANPTVRLAGVRVAIVDDFVTSWEQFDVAQRLVVSRGAEVVALGGLAVLSTAPIGRSPFPFALAVVVDAQVFQPGHLPEWLKAIPVQTLDGWVSIEPSQN